MSTATYPLARNAVTGRNAMSAILWGGLIAGALDATDRVVAYGFQGLNPVQVLQYIASGVLGPASFQGGLAAAGLGTLLHFLIAFVAAAVYVLASRRRDQPTLTAAIKEIGGDTIGIRAPHLNDGASIVLNTTFFNQAGTPETSVYASSKAAVRSFARTAAAELVGRGIRVNAASSGPIATPIYGRLGLPKEAVDAMAQGILATVPMKRFGKPEEIASTVLFLASSDSSYITGVEINVDGGVGQV